MYEPHIIENVNHIESIESIDGNDSNDDSDFEQDFENPARKYTSVKEGARGDEKILSEMTEEYTMMNYHLHKNFGNWQVAKNIISHSVSDKNNTEFFWDSLDGLLLQESDDFKNITRVIYKNNIENMIYVFENSVAKYLVDNLKIAPYKSAGYVFKNIENYNKWSFKIVVITTNGVYSFNRYIDNKTIGYY